MTIEQFNRKYSQWKEEGHYGLSLGTPEFIQWLDKKFQEFIKIPGFSYSQIKVKFGYGKFYCNGLSNEQISEVEQKLKELKNER
jgi:hypothetical protein